VTVPKATPLNLICVTSVDRYQQKMGALVCLLAVAGLVTSSLAAALPVVERRDAGIKVELSQNGATEVNAVLTNSGGETLKLVNYGTLMDKNPVQKLNVFKQGTPKFPAHHLVDAKN
jgi:hypothetical protein